MKTRLAVPDISCSACVAAIESALAPIAGVDTVHVDLPGRVVDVVHDATMDPVELVRAVEDQAYEVVAHEEVA